MPCKRWLDARGNPKKKVDLSPAGAAILGFIPQGYTLVTMEALK